MLQEKVYIPKPKQQLYHGTLQTGLKTIDPMFIYHKLSPEPVVWASWYRPFAAMFALPMTKTNFECVDYSEEHKNVCRYWVAIITKANEKYLSMPCSLYLIKPMHSVWKRPTKEQWHQWLPEAYTEGPCKVIKEARYRTVRECFEENNVAIIYNKKVSPVWQKLNKILNLRRKLV
jgi:hypothetical protein